MYFFGSIHTYMYPACTYMREIVDTCMRHTLLGEEA